MVSIIIDDCSPTLFLPYAQSSLGEQPVVCGLAAGYRPCSTDYIAYLLLEDEEPSLYCTKATYDELYIVPAFVGCRWHITKAQDTHQGCNTGFGRRLTFHSSRSRYAISEA